MPLVRAGTMLKRWHYATFWSPELVLCAARVHVGPIAQEYWGVWDRRDKGFWPRTNYVLRRVSLLPMKVAVDESEIGPVRFSEDLRSVSFSEGGGLFLVKSRYDHAFGPWEGSLPGGIQLRDAVGVRERRDALW